MSLLLLAATAHAGTTKLKPIDRTPLPAAGAAVDLAAIAPILSSDAVGDVLYLAGAKGLAAVDATGAVRWTLPLEPAAQRYVDADATHVAFTSFDVTGIEPGSAVGKFLLGELGDAPTYEHAKVGLATTAGELVWTVDAAEQSAASPPALSSRSVGVMLGADFAAHDRSDGHVLGSTHLSFVGADSKLFAGMFARATRLRPVVHEDHFYAGFWGYLLETDLDGNRVDQATGKGLTAYGDITCGPLPVGDLLVFGNTGDSLTRNNFFAVRPDLKDRWRAASPDLESGCGGIAVAGENVVVATNFWVIAWTPKGKDAWVTVNKKGGLYPSTYRGIRYVHGMGALKSHGDLLVADTQRVYVATGYEDGDAVTVLDATSGERLAAWKAPAPVASLALVGGRLAVVTPDAVTFATP